MYTNEYYRIQLMSRPSTPYRNHPPPGAGWSTANDNASVSSPTHSARTPRGRDGSGSPRHRDGSQQRNRSSVGLNTSSSAGGGTSAAVKTNTPPNESPYSVEYQRRFFEEHAAAKEDPDAKLEARAVQFYHSLRLAAEREKTFILQKHSSQQKAVNRPKQVGYAGASSPSERAGTSASSARGGAASTRASGMFSPGGALQKGRAQQRLDKADKDVLERLAHQLGGETHMGYHSPTFADSKRRHHRSHDKHSPLVSAELGSGKRGQAGRSVFLPTTEPNMLFSLDLDGVEKHIILASLEYVVDSGVLSDGSIFRGTIGWYRADVKKVFEILSTKFDEWSCLDYGSIEWNIIHNVLCEVRRGRSSKNLEISRTAYFGTISKRHVEALHEKILNDLTKKIKAREEAARNGEGTTTASPVGVNRMINLDDSRDSNTAAAVAADGQRPSQLLEALMAHEAERRAAGGGGNGHRAGSNVQHPFRHQDQQLMSEDGESNADVRSISVSTPRPRDGGLHAHFVDDVM